MECSITEYFTIKKKRKRYLEIERIVINLLLQLYVITMTFIKSLLHAYYITGKNF